MRGYNPQRRGTARPLPNFLCFCTYCLFCVVLCIVCVCNCVLYYCHRVATQLQLTNISYHKRRIYEKIVFRDQLTWQEPIKQAIVLSLTQTNQQTCFLAFLASSPLLYFLLAPSTCVALHAVSPLLISNSPELASPPSLCSFEFFML